MNRKEKLDIGAMHKALEALKPLINRVDELSHENIKIFEELESLQAGRDPTLAVPAPAPAPAPAPDNDMLYPPHQSGLNIPWLEFGNDIIGRKDWGKKSLATSQEKRSLLHDLFFTAKQEGFGIIRFWLLPSLWHGSKGEYSRDQISEAVNSTATLCDIARDVGVTLIPTMLSFDNYSEEKANNEDAVYPFTHESHNILFKAIVEVLTDNSDIIEFVDLLNEPEWATEDLEGGDPKPGAIKRTVMMQHMRRLASMFRSESNMKIGYGSASLKWRGHFGNFTDVHDFHAYDWSLPHFPPADASGKNLYMGETHIPYKDWADLFKDEKYKAVLLWLEKDQYRSVKKLRETLQTFKAG